jgi:hypothetical protein
VVPKRSNDFQRLVHLIFEHLSSNARVQESAMVMEVGLPTPTEREVDVLVEGEIAEVPWRMAVECRDRGRKDEIGWIDCLIGKYSHLPIDKIVAVSRSGLTRAAIEKAAVHRIEVRTLEGAMDVDWQKEFVKLAPGAVSIQVVVRNFAVVSTPPIPDDLDLNLFNCVQNGIHVGALLEVVNRYAHREGHRFFREGFGKTYQTIADLHKIALIEADSRPKEEVLLQHSGGSFYRLDQLFVLFELHTEMRKGDVEYFKFGNAVVSDGTVKLRSGKEFKISTVQAAGDSNIRIKIDAEGKGRKAAPLVSRRKSSKRGTTEET